MKNLGKLENITLLKVECDFDIEYLTFEGWHYEGIATYKIKGKKKKVRFICGENLNFKIGFLYSNDKRYITPEDRLDREALLVLIYGEIKKYLGKMEMIQYFKQKLEEEKEEKRKREELEKKKKIELGEQISIEKYLLNL